MNWLQKIAQQYARPEFKETLIYWNDNLEYNPLRGRTETPEGGMIAYLIEAAGDILRGYSEGYRDPGYINGKIQRLKYNLKDMNFRGELSENEIMWISEIKSTLTGLPTPSQEIEYVKTFILQLISKELDEARLTQQKLYERLRDQGLTFEE